MLIIYSNILLNMPRKHVFKIKIILLGDSRSGKSTFIKRLNMQDGRYTYQPTMGVDFHIHKVVDKEEPNTEYYLYFYDTSGANKFGNIIHSYYNYCPLAIIFTRPIKYTNNLTMYDNLKKWMIQYNLSRHFGQIIIIENSDDNDKNQYFDKKQISTFGYEYCSLLSNCNILLDTSIKTIIDTLITVIKENILKNDWITNVTEGVTKIDEIINVSTWDNCKPTDVVKLSRCSIM